MIKRSRMRVEAVGQAGVRFTDFGIRGEITDRIQQSRSPHDSISLSIALFIFLPESSSLYFPLPLLITPTSQIMFPLPQTIVFGFQLKLQYLLSIGISD